MTKLLHPHQVTRA